MLSFNKIELNIKNFGLISVAANLSDSKIIRIHFGKLKFGELKNSYLLLQAKEQILEYFIGELKEFILPIEYSGTHFQKNVWNNLQKIPYGKVVSYKQLAEKCGNNKAFRAVGMANNRNPIPLIIPCHRVINHNGQLGGFAPGIEAKKTLLKLENISIVDDKIAQINFIE